MMGPNSSRGPNSYKLFFDWALIRVWAFIRVGVLIPVSAELGYIRLKRRPALSSLRSLPSFNWKHFPTLMMHVFYRIL